MAAEPLWLDEAIARAIHHGQIADHGGSFGLRDPGLLVSALARARNKHLYDGMTDIFELAAAYTFGIARNHPFVDGNKRTAFAAGGVFLGLNGYDLDVPEPEAVQVITDVASGKLGEKELATWYRRGSRRAPG